MSSPTLSGAERGRVAIVGEVAGGIYLQDANGNLINRPAMLRLVREKDGILCLEWARQYMALRGIEAPLAGQLQRWSILLQMHFALIDPATNQRMFPQIASIADEKGKVQRAALESLPLLDLADGQLDKLWFEYGALQKRQTPATLTHEQWEALVNEGKAESLRTLHSKHGSSVLIHLLHGLDGRAWPE